MTDPDDVLRRSFVAIATDQFDAWPPLAGVADEVATMRAWLCNPDLGARRFEPEFEELARSPSKSEIEASLTGRRTFTSADALVVYVTGHGQTDINSNHWTVLKDSDPDRPSWRSLETKYFIQWLAGHYGLEHVFLIIDLCEAGNVQDAIRASFRNDLEPKWLVLLTTSADRDAKQGAFTGAMAAVLDDLRRGWDRDASDTQRYLNSTVFFGLVRDKLRDEHGQKLIALADPGIPLNCLPNPKYDPNGGDRVTTAAVRSDLAILEQDMTSHWGPRARGARSEAEPGWLFTDRAALMQRLVAFTTEPAGSLLVTGRAGSGKSAVLARMVTCSDPTFRREHPDLIAGAQAMPAEGAVDVAILATGKSAEQIAEQIAGALGGRAIEQGTNSALQMWIDVIARRTEVRTLPPTVVIDALDEAADPSGVVQSLLRGINPTGNPQLRLIVGVRSAGGDGDQTVVGRTDVGEHLGLAGTTALALGAEVVASDGDTYWRDEDLAGYVRAILTSPGSAYAVANATASTVASRVAASVERSYLLAAMVAGQLASADYAVGPEDRRLDALLSGGVAELLQRDIISSLPDPADRRRAIQLLRTSALSLGRGVPWRDVWPVLAGAVADDGTEFGDSDVAWLLDQRISGYLVRDLEDGVPVYRPFHDALRGALALDGERLLDDFVGSAVMNARDAVVRIGRTLAAMIKRADRQGRTPPAYARRHLADYVVGKVDVLAGDSVLTPVTLPWLDADSLSRALRLHDAIPGSGLSRLLTAWRGVRHRWSWDRADSNAVALDVALLATGDAAPSRRPSAGVLWRPQWVVWTWGGTVIGRDLSAITDLAAGDVAGLPAVAVSGRTEFGVPFIQLWEASTGLLLGQPLVEAATSTDLEEVLGTPVPEAKAIAMAAVAETTLVAATFDDSVKIWDATTGVLAHRLRMPEGGGRTVAMGSFGGRGLVVVGTGYGRVRIWDLESGVAVRDIEVSGPVRGLTLGEDVTGAARLIVGVDRYPDSSLEQFEPISGGTAAPSIPLVGGQINGVAWTVADGVEWVAAGARNVGAQTWLAATGEPVGGVVPSEAEVRVVAFGDSDDGVLLASAGNAHTVKVSRPGQPDSDDENLSHPGPVRGAEFLRVDGRLMLATACDDGNARLWDAARPTGAGRAARVKVESLSLLRAGHGLLLAGGGLDHLFVWDAGTGAAILDQNWERELWIRDFPPVAVSLGSMHGRTMLLAANESRASFLDVDSGAIEHEATLEFDHSYPRSRAVRIDRAHAFVATRSSDNSITVIDMSADGSDTAPIATDHYIQDAYFVEGTERALLAVAVDGEVLFMEPATDAPIRRIPVQDYSSRVCAGSLDGRDVLGWTNSGLLHIWDVSAAAPHRAPFPLTGWARGMAFAKLGDRDLVLAMHNATVRAYNPQTGRLVTELPFGTTINAFSVLPGITDDHVLVAVGGPGVMVTELWNV